MIEDILSVANLTLVFGALVAISSGVQAIIVGLHETWVRLKQVFSPATPSRLFLAPSPDEIKKYSIRTRSAVELNELTEHKREEGKRTQMLRVTQLREIERSNGRLISMAFSFIGAFIVIAYSFVRVMIFG